MLWQPEIKRSCLCWKADVWSGPGGRNERKCEKLLITLSLGNGWIHAQCSFSHTHFIFLRNVPAIKYFFPPMNLLISVINKLQFSFIFSIHMQPNPSSTYSHSTCPHLPLQRSKHLLHFALMARCGCINYQKGPACLLVYTPVPVAAMCDRWYALMASLFSMDMPLSL